MALRLGHQPVVRGAPAPAPDVDLVQAALRGFLVVLAISLHAVFEGIAMGLTNNSRFKSGCLSMLITK